MYGVLPTLADLTETHVFHPDWTPHFRLYLVWLLSTNGALTVFSLYMMWASRIDVVIRTRVAGLVGICAVGCKRRARSVAVKGRSRSAALLIDFRVIEALGLESAREEMRSVSRYGVMDEDPHAGGA